MPPGETVAAVCCSRNYNPFAFVENSTTCCRTHCIICRSYCYCVSPCEICSVGCISCYGYIAWICSAAIIPSDETVAIVWRCRDLYLSAICEHATTSCSTHSCVCRINGYSVVCYRIWIAKADCRCYRFRSNIGVTCSRTCIVQTNPTFIWHIVTCTKRQLIIDSILVENYTNLNFLSTI